MKTSFIDYLLCGTVLGLVFSATVSFVWFGIAPLSLAWCGRYGVIVDVLLGLLTYGAFSAGAMRLLLAMRPLPTGEFSMNSPAFTYWKLLTIIHMFAHEALRPFTNAFTTPFIAQLFGARIGRNVAVGGIIQEPFLVTIGDDATLGQDSFVAGSVIIGGRITIAPVRIGDGATVGVNAVVLAGTEIGSQAVLAGGAFVTPGAKIPSGEIWKGNPARKWNVIGGPRTGGESVP